MLKQDVVANKKPKYFHPVSSMKKLGRIVGRENYSLIAKTVTRDSCMLPAVLSQIAKLVTKEWKVFTVVFIVTWVYSPEHRSLILKTFSWMKAK